jgi:signal transduction histidine kinase
MRAKLITLFLITFTGLLAVLVWRLDQIVYQDKIEAVETQSRAQLSALVKAFESELQRAEGNLLLGYPQISQVSQDYGNDFPYSMFLMISELKFEDSAWKAVTPHYRSGSEAKKWGLAYSQLELAKIQAEKVPAGATRLSAIIDSKSQPHFLFLMNRQIVNPKDSAQKRQAWFLGLTQTDFLQNVLDRQKGQSAEVFLTNLDGQALGHTEPDYIGKLLTEHPIVKEIQQNQAGSGSGFFSNLEGRKVQGFYEQIPNTNLYAVISQPTAPLIAQRDELRMQLILLGMGLALMGVGVLVVIYKPEKEIVRIQPPEPAKKVSSAAVSPAPVASSPASLAVVPKASENPEERLKAYRTVASSLSHELWGPLTTILGHSTAMKSALTGTDEYAKLEKIEEQSRVARDVVQKLLTFSGEDKPKNRTDKFEELINKAIKRVDGKILGKGIKLKKDFSSLTNLVPEGLMRAIEALLANAIESLERAPSKEISLRGYAQGDHVILEIQDTGEGIEPQNLSKVFDPFFTSRGHGHHLGMGLSLALGLVREAQGEIEIESERGKGTTVKIKLPGVQAAETAEAKLNVVPKASPVLEVPKAALTLETPPLTLEIRPQNSPLLIDDTIEKMLDGEEPDDLTAKKVEKLEGLDLPPLPEDEFVVAPQPALTPSQPTPVSTPAFSSKIDKPKIELKKKDSKLSHVEVSIRRPGEKS